LPSARKPSKSAEEIRSARWLDRTSKAGLAATSAATSSALAASAAIAAPAPTVPTRTPAKAGPSTTDTLMLEASSELAVPTSSGPASSGSVLTNEPELNGRVTL
jgi:hypothetical protein